MRSAIYAGSFDPFTLGHLNLIRRGAVLFDELIVAVGNNPAKKYLFSAEERRDLLQQACADIPNARFVFFDGLLVDTARELGAQVILRGLRAISDFEPELRNGLANRDIGGIETLFLLSDAEYIYVSSSLVKEIAMHGGDVSRYVPPLVADALQARFQRT